MLTMEREKSACRPEAVPTSVAQAADFLLKHQPDACRPPSCPQGLKAQFFCCLAARLKPCPSQILVEDSDDTTERPSPSKPTQSECPQSS